MTLKLLLHESRRSEKICVVAMMNMIKIAKEITGKRFVRERLIEENEMKFLFSDWKITKDLSTVATVKKTLNAKVHPAKWKKKH